MNYTIKALPCGCRIKREHGIIYLEYCPKHAAAPDMYEALKAIISAVEKGKSVSAFVPALKAAKEALAKAEGK